jgi:hypothetical protein
VIHHHGSKERLRAVLEERAAAVVETMLAGYVRRLLSDGGPAGAALFERLYQATRAGVRALEQAGVVRSSMDDPVRDAFLLSNDPGMLLLQPLTSQVTGIDPLARDGWSAGRRKYSTSTREAFSCLPVQPGQRACRLAEIKEAGGRDVRR